MLTLGCLLLSMCIPVLRGQIENWSSWGSVPTAQYSMPSGVINDEVMYIFEEDGSIYKKSDSTSWESVNPSVTVEIECNLAKCSTTINDRFIYILQGKSDRPKRLWIFDTSTEEWLQDVIPLPVAVGGACVTSDNANFIYVVAGYDDNDYPNTIPIIQIYDINNEVWCNNTNLLFPSYYPGCVYYNEFVYLFGGYEDGKEDKIQIFDINTKEWEYASNLIRGTGQMRAIVGNDNLIYMIGGFNDLDGYDPSTLVQVYDPSTNQMVQNGAVSLNTGRAAFTAESVNGQIVVCSGKDGNSYTELRECEISNTLTGTQSVSQPSTAATGICISTDTSEASSWKFVTFCSLVFAVIFA